MVRVSGRLTYGRLSSACRSKMASTASALKLTFQSKYTSMSDDAEKRPSNVLPRTGVVRP